MTAPPRGRRFVYKLDDYTVCFQRGVLNGDAFRSFCRCNNLVGTGSCCLLAARGTVTRGNEERRLLSFSLAGRRAPTIGK